MKKYFQNKVVIITGSSMGIGKATALELARQGADVVINGRDDEKLAIALREIRAINPNALAVQADVTNKEDCQMLVDIVVDNFGRIDAIISNAGVGMFEQFEKMNESALRKVIDTNLLSAMYVAQCGIPKLKKSKGSLIFISSTAGKGGVAGASVYSAAKMALTALAQSLHCELKEHKVHVGIVYVWFTENDKRKREISADGNLITLSNRPRLMVQSQKQTAKGIIKNLKNRKFKTTLSFMGKLNGMLARYFPDTHLLILSSLQKR